MIGTMFGPYRIVGLLGRGGMGEVYHAVDTSQDDRPVALKVLLPAISADPHFAGRFRREAHIAASISDPHVPPVHRYGEIGGRLFLDMQLVSGRSLAEILDADGALGAERAVAIVEQVAAALDAAHASGLVHRDVKPGNILLTERDGSRPEIAYLVDFGLALATGGGSQTALTRTGTIAGTLGYMAPERFLARPVGPPVDVYALACVLHELLTGSRPFPGTGHAAQIAGHVEMPPPRPSALRPGLPSGLDEVVAHGMAKEPTARPRTAGELAAAARAALRSAPVVALTPAGGRPSPVRRAAPTEIPATTAPPLPGPSTAGLPPGALTPPPPLHLPRPETVQLPARARRSRLRTLAVVGVMVTVLGVPTGVLVTTSGLPLPTPAAAPVAGAAPAQGAMPSDQPIIERALPGRAPSLGSPTVTRLGDRPVLVVEEIAKYVHVLDLATGQPIGRPIRSTIFSSATATVLDGRSVVLTGTADGAVRLWDLETGQALPTMLTGPRGVIIALAATEVDGRSVVFSACSDGTVWRWDLSSDAPTGAPVEGPTAEVDVLSVAGPTDRPVVLGATRDSRIHSWDALTGRPAGPPIAAGTAEPAAIELATGTALVVKDGGTVSVHDIATADILFRTSSVASAPVAGATVEGRPLIVISDGLEIVVTDLLTGEPVTDPLAGHEAGIAALATVEVDGSTFLVSSSYDRSIRIWDLTRRTQV